MADAVELLVTGLAGLAGAAIGAMATMRAAAFAHRKQAAIARDKAVADERALNHARAWHLVHGIRMMHASLIGARRRILDGMAAAPQFTGDDLWRAIRNASVGGETPRFEADHLQVLFRVGQPGLSTKLLDLQEGAAGVHTLLRDYTADRKQMIDTFADEIFRLRLSTQQLIAKDGRFRDTVLNAQILRDFILAEAQEADVTVREFFTVMRPIIDEMGLKVQVPEVDEEVEVPAEPFDETT